MISDVNLIYLLVQVRLLVVDVDHRLVDVMVGRKEVAAKQKQKREKKNIYKIN